MRRKARESLREALALQASRGFNGAANRAYYAIFQALVGELQHLAASPKPSQFPGYFEVDYPDRWTHRLVRYIVANRRDLLALDSNERALLRTAWELRGKADYEPTPVHPDEIGAILNELPAFLRDQGA